MSKNLHNVKWNLTALTVMSAFMGMSPALADNYNSNTLPRGDQFFKARKQFQIVDEAPRVTETRKADDSQTYVINVPPAPQGTNQIIRIGGDGTTSGGGPQSNVIPIRQNNLPFAGPTSNISAHEPYAKNLPPGQNGHRLATDALLLKQARPSNQNLMARPASIGGSGPSPVKTYDTVLGASSAGSTQSKIDVRGDLIGRSKHGL